MVTVAEVDVARLDICNTLALEWGKFSTEQEIDYSDALTSTKVHEFNQLLCSLLNVSYHQEDVLDIGSVSFRLSLVEVGTLPKGRSHAAPPQGSWPTALTQNPIGNPSNGIKVLIEYGTYRQYDWPYGTTPPYIVTMLHPIIDAKVRTLTTDTTSLIKALIRGHSDLLEAVDHHIRKR